GVQTCALPICLCSEFRWLATGFLRKMRFLSAMACRIQGSVVSRLGAALYRRRPPVRGVEGSPSPPGPLLAGGGPASAPAFAPPATGESPHEHPASKPARPGARPARLDRPLF